MVKKKAVATLPFYTLGHQGLVSSSNVKLTPSLADELEGTRPEFQDKLAWLLNYASAMGDYGDPHGELAILSPQSGKVLMRESEVKII